MGSRSRTTAAAIRLSAAGLLVAAALPLSACGFPFTPYTGGAKNLDVTSAPTPTDSTTDDSSGSGTLHFGDASLPAGRHVEWSDGLIADARWKVATPDDGNGNWSYATVDGLCTVHFWQGTSSSTGGKDDREASDLMLAALTQATIADVTAAASDRPFQDATSGGADIDSRAVQGQNDTATWVIQARVFEQAGAGIYFILDCTDGNAQVVAQEIVEKDPILVR